MIIDERTEFCDATSVAAAAGTALVGDVIDLGTAGRDVGNGQPIYLVMTVDTSIITGGVAGTIRFALASDAQAAIATDGSATVHFETGDFVTDDDALNALDAGDVIAVVALPLNSVATYERYLGILATIGTTTVTEGAINAFLTTQPYGWQAYADGDR
ncbi:MAG: Bbp16 family capsid cement protein [Kiloniellales bacterium]